MWADTWSALSDVVLEVVRVNTMLSLNAETSSVKWMVDEIYLLSNLGHKLGSADRTPCYTVHIIKLFLQTVYKYQPNYVPS